MVRPRKLWDVCNLHLTYHVYSFTKICFVSPTLSKLWNQIQDTRKLIWVYKQNRQLKKQRVQSLEETKSHGVCYVRREESPIHWCATVACKWAEITQGMIWVPQEDKQKGIHPHSRCGENKGLLMPLIGIRHTHLADTRSPVWSLATLVSPLVAGGVKNHCRRAAASLRWRDQTWWAAGRVSRREGSFLPCCGLLRSEVRSCFFPSVSESCVMCQPFLKEQQDGGCR